MLEAYCPGVPVGRRPGSAGPSPSSATARAIARRTSLVITAGYAGGAPASSRTTRIISPGSKGLVR